MSEREDRRRRSDAERNRRRVLEAAAEVFREQGLEAPVGEIAQRAGVGRGTLFRNFPSKADLIAAILVDEMSAAAARARALCERPDAGAALFEFLDDIAGRQRADRALFEAVADSFLANPEIRLAHDEVIAALDELLSAAKAAGAVRADIGAVDVLLLLKGVCEVAGTYGHVDPGLVDRQLDLVRCALSAPAESQPLRGRTLSADELDPRSPPAAHQPSRRRRASV
ncbi:MAG: TetR/AcrR family transcriptional regulator [Solirubrobacterales bacterium]|nr:TetR/AcrR family transcriptional regulator [Solirubrobacterales bacterium]MBV9715660.1 TetR/AcrR family transcriptional regulator [Solirubrobacterales bacterium]